MGFFGSGGGKSAPKGGLPSLELIHRLQCKVCPLNKITTNQSPHMEPSGAKDPLIYVLGDAPSGDDDADTQHFSTQSDTGAMLRARFPKPIRNFMRWNYVVRTHTPKGREPERIEVEACRPSVEKDIAATKPKAIFGFGKVPLHWAIGSGDVRKWRGKRIPIEVAGHACWYYAFDHPRDLLRQRRRNGDIGELERAFRFDIKRALDEIEELPDPVVLGRADAESGITLIPCTTAGLAKLEEYLNWAVKQPSVGVDYETNALRPYGKPIMDRDDELVLRWEESKILSAAVGTMGSAVAVAFDHPQAKWSKGNRLRLDAIWDKFIRTTNVRKAVHNLAFEMEWSAVFYGADVLRASEWDDTFTMAVLLDERSMADNDERRSGGASLDDLVLQHFGLHLKAMSPLDRKDLANEPLPVVLRYNAMDAKFHAGLAIVLRARLEAQRLWGVYSGQDLHRVPTMVLTQIKGIPRDQAVTAELQTKYRTRVDKLLKEIEAMPEVAKYRAKFKKPYNAVSNKDAIAMFRDLLGRNEGYDVDGETRADGFVSTHPTNAEYAVDKKVLERIGTPLALATIKLREASKRLSTYIDPYADGSPNIFPDGMLHPVSNPQGTKSGRGAGTDPNVRNIPKRDEEAKEVRRQIKPADQDEVVVAVDYGQIQARGIAMMSKDKAFVKSLWERYDVHTEWAQRIAMAYPKRIGGKANLTDKKVMKNFRTDIKNQWTFPLFFGAKLYGISNFLQIPEETLKPLMDEFWRTFHGVADWHARLLQEYQDTGQVRHLNGRVNRAPLSFNQMINYPIQGLEAEIVQEAYANLSTRCTNEGDINWQPNLEIYDDLTFILPAKKVDQYVEGIVTDMLAINRPYINVPLTVEVLVGDNLLDLEEILVASSDTWKKAA